MPGEPPRPAHDHLPHWCIVDAWATAKDLARLYDVKVGTIHAWASQDRWRRKDTWPRRYAWDDAQDSWERRHPGDWQHYAARPDQ